LQSHAAKATQVSQRGPEVKLRTVVCIRLAGLTISSAGFDPELSAESSDSTPESRPSLAAHQCSLFRRSVEVKKSIALKLKLTMPHHSYGIGRCHK
jgi:hypothetical protein